MGLEIFLSEMLIQLRVWWEKRTRLQADTQARCHVCDTPLNNGRLGTYCAKCDL